MRPILLFSVLILSTLVGRSQSSTLPNTILNCFVVNGHVDYGPLGKLLPDSLKTTLLIDPRKEFNMRDGNYILLWLEQRGWKLLAVDNPGSGTNGSLSIGTIYILSKDIYLDDAARTVFLQKLESLQARKQ